jgi:hypothetical protein
VSAPVCGGAAPPADVLGEDPVAAAVAGVTLGNALGETGVVAGIEGVLTRPAADAVPRGAAEVEAADGLHAETPKAALASTAQTARNLTLRECVVNMDSGPFDFLSGSASHSTHMTYARPPWLAPVLARGKSPAAPSA